MAISREAQIVRWRTVRRPRRPIDCDRPTKVDVTDEWPLNIQLRLVHLSRKNYGEMRQNQYAHHKRRFSKRSSSILSGEGFDERERGESPFVLVTTLQIGSTLPNLLESEVIEIVPLKPEETLHHYLRRHFEKVSKNKARQFAEQGELPKVDVVPDAPSSDGSQP
jgi:hypothetical protein